MFIDSQGNQRKIVDCTFFNDELDILEIRLDEHDKFCDYFVIVEGNKTFANKHKPYYFDLSNPRIMAIWMKYKDRIYYHRISEYPSFDSWGMENFSRRSTGVGIASFKSRGLINDNDFVLLSDVDEIVDHRCMSPASRFENKSIYQWNFQQSFRYFYFNYLAKNEPWSAPAMTLIKNYNDPHKLRHHDNLHPVEYIPNGGWHFSYMGGPKGIINKLESTAHRELDRSDLKNELIIEDKLNNFKDPLNRNGYIFEEVEDENYPQFILDNLDRFGKYFNPEWR